MSLSIPSDNLRKINNLDEIPYKDVKLEMNLWIKFQ